MADINSLAKEVTWDQLEFDQQYFVILQDKDGVIQNCWVANCKLAYEIVSNIFEGAGTLWMNGKPGWPYLRFYELSIVNL